jgi:hypothetical protein
MEITEKLSLATLFCLFGIQSALAFDTIPPLKPITNVSGSISILPNWAATYNFAGNSYFPACQYVQRSLYEPIDCGFVQYWDNALEEMVNAGCNKMLILSRTSVDDNFIAFMKQHLVPAMKRTGLSDYLKVGLFDDSASWADCWEDMTGNTSIDWSDSTNIDKLLWDYNVKRFYDAVPRNMWLYIDNRPVVVFWNYGTTNTNLTLANERRALNALRTNFKARYGIDIYLVPINSWRDIQYGEGMVSDSKHDWLRSDESGSGLDFSSFTLDFLGQSGLRNNAIVVPGFMIFDDAGNIRTDIGPQDRANGDTLRNKLQFALDHGCTWVLHEGWNDERESCSSFRGIDWDYPNQYLNIMREFQDPYTETRRFEAEACDEANDTTTGNSGGQFTLAGDLDIYNISTDANIYGWVVGNIAATEWLKWYQVKFDTGNYDIYIKYASTASKGIQFLMGTNTNYTLPSTGGLSTYQGLKIATRYLTSGTAYDFRLKFSSSNNLNVDYLQFVKTSGNMTPPFTPTTPPAVPTPNVTTSTLTPTDDTFIDKNNPTTTYGTSTQLMSQVGLRYIYLKFDLSTISDANTIYKAYLKLYPYQVSGDRYGAGLYGIANDGWSGDSLTWDTRSSYPWDNVGYGWVYWPTVNNWYTIDATELVRREVAGDKTASMAVVVTSSNIYIRNYSKEYSSGSYAPQLVVQVWNGSKPGQASSPTPSNGATGVSFTQALSWTAGSGTSVSHDVYLGTNSADVTAATHLSGWLYRSNQDATSYATGPASFAPSTTYYWRIDESGVGGIKKGTVWSFTTQAATVVTPPTPPALKYTEKFHDITIDTASTWTDVDLTSYDVSANQVVEIGIRNSSISTVRSGGVRTKGSSIDRRLNLHYATTQGWDMVTMQVKTDANKKIQAYAGNTSDVHFYLIGYWNSGSYTEKYEAFTAGSTGGWVDADLTSYGIDANSVVEVMVTNTSTGAAYAGGVRGKGSLLNRKIMLHKSKGTANDVYTIMAKADANKKIQVWSDNASVSFRLLGYWSTSPGTYNETFINMLRPVTNATWVTRKLAGCGVTPNAVCEFVIGNAATSANDSVGVRRVGSSLSRLFQEHQNGTSGSRDCVMMHVSADPNSSIQQYQTTTSNLVDFDLMGYWN